MNDLEPTIDAAGMLPFLLGGLAIAFLLLALEVGRRLARANRVARAVPGDASSRWEELQEDASATVVDWRSGTKSAPLRRSFKQVRKLLRQMLPGARSSYRTPWLLTLGPTASGKTTLLGQSGLVLPLGEPGEIPDTAPSGCNWWLFDRAVAADLAGDLTLRAEGTESSQLAWRGFLQLLKRYRTEHPADGILLVLSAREFLGVAADDTWAQENLAARASVLRRKLLDAQATLGLRLPVFVLVSQCDLVEGYGDFVELLDPELRRETFGWSAPGAFDKPYSPSWVDRVFSSTQRALCLAQLRALTERRSTAGERRLTAFPAALCRLQEPLAIVLNQIFAGGSAEEPAVLRGVYFCGGRGFPTPSSSESPDETSAPPRLKTAGEDHRRVDFLHDLFRAKILYEWNLARPTARALRRRRRLVTVLRSLLVVTLLSLSWLLWNVTQQIPARAKVLAGLLDPIEIGLGGGLLNSDEIAHQLRESRQKISAYSLGFPPVPWPADRELRRSFAQLYSKNTFPAARRALGNGLDQLATKPTRQLSPQVPVLGVETVPEFTLLEQLSAKLGRVENSLRIYDCFVPQGLLCGSPGGIYRLEQDLYGERFEPPNAITQQFVRRVLRQVKVDEYQVEEYAPKLQAKTRQLSRWMFDTLFEHNALVLALDKLDKEINQVTIAAPSGSAVAWTAADAGSGILASSLDGGAGGLSGAGFLGAVGGSGAAGSGAQIDPEALANAAARLLFWIETVDLSLEDVGLNWVHGKSLDLGLQYDRWWRAMGKSRFLGVDMRRELATLGNEGFTTLQSALVAPRSDIGPLLERSPDSGRFVLSAPLQQLRRSLQEFLSQPFSGKQGGGRLLLAGDDEYLSWRADSLRRAVGAFSEYDSSIKALDDDPQGVEVMHSQTALTELANYVLSILEFGQEILRQPALDSNDQLADHLERIATAFLANSDDLVLLQVRLQETLPDPVTCKNCLWQPESAWCQLKKVVEYQREYIFQMMKRMLDAYYPYRVDAGLLASWDGSTGPARTLFSFADTDAAASNFTTWLALVQKLDETYTQALLGAKSSSNCFNHDQNQRRFQLIQSDLQDLANDKPNSAAASLRELVTQTMMTVDGSSCLAALEPRKCFSLATPVSLRNLPCDYFLSRGGDLTDALEQRCSRLGVELARSSYASIRQAFSGGLEGKYPFTADFKTGQSQASRKDVVSFLKIYDDHRAAVDSFLRRAASQPQRGFDFKKLSDCLNSAAPAAACGGSLGTAVSSTATAASAEVSLARLCSCLSTAAKPLRGAKGLLGLCDFMASLATLRDFFDPYLLALVKGPQSALSFPLEVDYRMQRQQREVDANQIIRWAVEVNGQKVPDGSQEVPTEWVQGQPVKLLLGWAQDAPREPYDQPGGPPVVGKTVTFDYQNNWALLTLLGSHQSPTPGICPDILELFIPTIKVGAEPSTQTVAKRQWHWPWNKPSPPPTPPPPRPDREARVFIRVRLLGSDGQAVRVPLPETLQPADFPVEVSLGTW